MVLAAFNRGDEQYVAIRQFLQPDLPGAAFGQKLIE